jgi:hypothetical protein
MHTTSQPLPTAAYQVCDEHTYQSSALTRGPWHPDHQHAGPPIALACRAIEAVAKEHGLGHLARLTANLLRPVPIGKLRVYVTADYVGRNAGHFSAQLTVGGKEVARFTALAQREADAVAAAEAEVARLAEAEAKAAALESARQELLAAGISEAAVDAIMSSRQ